MHQPHPSDQLPKLSSLLLPQPQTKHLWGQWERGLLPTAQQQRVRGPNLPTFLAGATLDSCQLELAGRRKTNPSKSCFVYATPK